MSPFYGTLIENMQSGFILYDRDKRIVMCNRRATQILRMTKEELEGNTAKAFADKVFREDGTPLPFADMPVNIVHRTGKPLQGLILGLAEPDSAIMSWISINAAPVMVDARIENVVISFMDVTPLKTTLDSLRRSEANLKSILDHTPVGVCITDHKGVFEDANDAYCQLYGYKREELIGSHFTMVVPPANRAFLSEMHDRFIDSGAEIRGEWDVVDKWGHEKAIIADAARIVMTDSKVRKVTFVLDVTDRKRYEDQIKEKNALLEEQNRRDGLTKLYNRTFAMERLEELTHEFKRYGSSFCVALLDIDHFKKVNDTYGHQAGDEVLTQVARELRERSRETDLAARFGGEEFILVMPHTVLAGAMAAVDKIRLGVKALSMTAQGIKVTVSGGVSQYVGQDILHCIDQADKALYRAKNTGRDKVCPGPEREGGG
ncbi:MAG: diguanylate cyclase [Desulfovibrio sp.]|nr:diguanylate cyclase [Desulfovibrio sp.]